jgi:hypothetical protein
MAQSDSGVPFCVQVESLMPLVLRRWIVTVYHVPNQEWVCLLGLPNDAGHQSPYFRSEAAAYDHIQSNVVAFLVLLGVYTDFIIEEVIVF